MEYPKTLKDAIVLIDELRAELKKYTESPYLTAFNANRKFMEDNCEKIQNNMLDYSEPENKPIWEVRHKFLTEIQPYLENDEFLRNKMSPEQKRELEKEEKFNQLDIATKMAIKNKK
jgi:hypothetical protein